MVNTKYIKSKNPQFFQPILPGSFQELAIPSGFLKKYMRREKCEEGEAVLRNSGKTWPVKVNGFCCKEGWSDFARDRHLHIGDFVIFTHRGRMLFDVTVFDRSACEKEYPELHVQKEINKEEMAENRGKEAIVEKKIRNFKDSVRTRYGRHKAAKEYAASCKFIKPFFVVPIAKSNLTSRGLNIPNDFALSNGLIGKSFEVVLKDQQGRSLSVQLRERNDGQVCLRDGWLEFAVANHLKEEQLCIFKLICSGNIHEDRSMVFDVTVVNTKVSHIEPNKPSSFVTSLKNWTFVNSLLHVHREFSKFSDLERKMRRKIILKDQKGRTWELKLKLMGMYDIYLRGDWRKISAANGLEEGDTIILQLTRTRMT